MEQLKENEDFDKLYWNILPNSAYNQCPSEMHGDEGDKRMI